MLLIIWDLGVFYDMSIQCVSLTFRERYLYYRLVCPTFLFHDLSLSVLPFCWSRHLCLLWTTTVLGLSLVTVITGVVVSAEV